MTHFAGYAASIVQGLDVGTRANLKEVNMPGKIAATLLAMLFAIDYALAAASWQSIFSSDEVELSIDRSRPLGTGGVRQGWFMLIYHKPRKQIPNLTSGAYQTVISLNYANCHTRKIASPYGVYYAGEGSSSENVGEFGNEMPPSSEKFIETTPGSLGQMMLEAICANSPVSP